MIEQEFFSVTHSMTVNIEALPLDTVLPEQTQFEAEIPAPFIVACEFSHLDSMGDLAKRELKQHDFPHLLQLLDAQNSKLNLLLNFLLSQQDEPEYRHATQTFGASQFSFFSPQPWDENTPVRAKLFLDHPAAAIYCYGHTVSCQAHDGQYVVAVKYDRMRDDDQDLLIKAALYQQQKLLRQRAADKLNSDK